MFCNIKILAKIELGFPQQRVFLFHFLVSFQHYKGHDLCAGGQNKRVQLTIYCFRHQRGEYDVTSNSPSILTIELQTMGHVMG